MKYLIFFFTLLYSSCALSQTTPSNSFGSGPSSAISRLLQEKFSIDDKTNKSPNISQEYKSSGRAMNNIDSRSRNINRKYNKERPETKDFGLDINEDARNPRKSIFLPRKVTPRRLFSADLSRPAKFVSSNNLIRKPGSFYQAIGEVIMIRGKITDSFGVPVSGAVVQIWQTNSAGKYQSLLEKNSEFVDINFNMSGRAITDNLGNYHFLTIMPGSYLNRSPHINFNVFHKQFDSIETEMYFENHPKNKFDHEYLSYTEEEREMLTAKVKLSNMFKKESQKICTFNIVMDGVHKYKSFGGDI